MPYQGECAHCGAQMELQWAQEISELNWCQACRRLGAELWKKIGEYRTELANEVMEERNQRWLANCPVAHRSGHHMPLDNGRSYKSEPKYFGEDARQNTEELEAERFAVSSIGGAHGATYDPGLRNWSDQTCSREEYFKMMDRLNSRREQWLL